MQLIIAFHTLKLSDTCTSEKLEATKSPFCLIPVFHAQLLLSVQSCSVSREKNCAVPEGEEEGESD